MKILHWCVWITADVWYQRWGSCSQGCNNDSVVVTGHHVSAAKKQQTNKHLDHHTTVHGQDDQARTILVYSLIYYSSSLFWETCNSNTLEFMALFFLILIILGWVLHLLRHSDTSLIFADFILNNFVQLVQSHAVLETPAIRILLCDSELTSLKDLGATTY